MSGSCTSKSSRNRAKPDRASSAGSFFFCSCQLFPGFQLCSHHRHRSIQLWLPGQLPSQVECHGEPCWTCQREQRHARSQSHPLKLPSALCRHCWQEAHASPSSRACRKAAPRRQTGIEYEEEQAVASIFRRDWGIRRFCCQRPSAFRHARKVQHEWLQAGHIPRIRGQCFAGEE